MGNNSISNKYGLPQVLNRPLIKVEKKLCLSGEEGQQIIKSETKRLLIAHKRTFARLANM